MRGGDWQVSSKVIGTDEYNVSLRREEDALVVTCDCEFFADRMDTCKHVWATLLAADRWDYLKADGKNNGIFIDIEFPDEDRNNGRAHPPRNQRARPRKRRNRRKKKSAAWQSDLAVLENQLRRPGSGQRGPNAWTTRQLVYILEAWYPPDPEHLPFSVGFRERKRNGDWTLPKTQSLNHQILPLLSDPVDREAVACLLGAQKETPFGNGVYTERNEHRYRVGRELAEVLLPAFAPRVGVSCAGRIAATSRCSPGMKALHGTSRSASSPSARTNSIASPASWSEMPTAFP